MLFWGKSSTIASQGWVQGAITKSIMGQECGPFMATRPLNVRETFRKNYKILYFYLLY